MTTSNVLRLGAAARRPPSVFRRPPSDSRLSTPDFRASVTARHGSTTIIAVNINQRIHDLPGVRGKHAVRLRRPPSNDSRLPSLGPATDYTYPRSTRRAGRRLGRTHCWNIVVGPQPCSHLVILALGTCTPGTKSLTVAVNSFRLLANSTERLTPITSTSVRTTHWARGTGWTPT